jgi:hypothetical protein
MPGPRGELCETCRFWSAHADNPGVGECRRHAPRAAVSAALADPDLDYHANDVWWPVTIDLEWCGEHQPREGG